MRTVCIDTLCLSLGLLILACGLDAASSPPPGARSLGWMAVSVLHILDHRLLNNQGCAVWIKEALGRRYIELRFAVVVFDIPVRTGILTAGDTNGAVTTCSMLNPPDDPCLYQGGSLIRDHNGRAAAVFFEPRTLARPSQETLDHLSEAFLASSKKSESAMPFDLSTFAAGVKHDLENPANGHSPSIQLRGLLISLDDPSYAFDVTEGHLFSYSHTQPIGVLQFGNTFSVVLNVIFMPGLAALGIH